MPEESDLTMGIAQDAGKDSKGLRPQRSEDTVSAPTPEHNDSAAKGTLFASILSIASIFIRSGVTFALMPVLITALGEEHYALWITVSSVTMFLCLSEAGLGQTVINSVGSAFAKGDFDSVCQIQTTAHVLYWMLVIPTCVIALLCLAFLPVSDWLLAKSDISNGPLFITCLAITTILALARIPYLVFPAMLTGLRNLPLRLMCEMGATIIVALGTALAAVAGTGLIGVTVLANALLLVTTIAMYFLLTKTHPWTKLRLSAYRSEQLWPLAVNSGFFF